MAARSHTAAQRDFSAGEVDLELKRSEDHPIFRSSVRQCSNFRITNGRKLKNRFGRTALFIDGPRVDEVLMLSGNVFYLCFSGVASGVITVRNSAGAVVFTQSGFGWRNATVGQIVWDIASLSIYIAFPGNIPHVLSWDGVATWSIANLSFDLLPTGGFAFPFIRIAPKGITLTPSALSGSITLTSSANYFVVGMNNNHIIRLRFRQILVNNVTSPTTAACTVLESIFATTSFTLTNVNGSFFPGEIVVGSNGEKGEVVSWSAGNPLVVNFITNTGFTGSETVAGPNGTATINVGTPATAAASTIWDEQAISNFYGWPGSVFVDQGRLGMCNMPAVPGGIIYSALGIFTNFYIPVTGVVPGTAIFELAPKKSQVLFVVPGMEGSEFIFCDNAVYYFPITLAQPLSALTGVAFNLLTRDGCAANVQPQLVQEALVYVSAGSSTLRAIAATGAYQRPYEIRPLSELHDHLFNAPVTIAAPSATDPNFPERYIYVLNANGTLAVGKLKVQDGRLMEMPGWVSMSGVGTINWVNARGADVIFTTTYQPGAAAAVTIAEKNDATQYIDAGMLYNSVPTALTPPGGKGPLWWLVSGTVTVMDLGTRQLGLYNVDANGFLIPQRIGGENLTSSQLMVGQQWTAILEPWMAGPEPGADYDQRFTERGVERIGVYYQNSTGFVFQKLFSAKQTRTSPALGSVVKTSRVPTYNQDDDPTQPPPLRENFDYWRPGGREYDPRIALVKDTAGPLTILEIGSEVTV